MSLNRHLVLSFDSIDSIARCDHLGRTKYDVTEGRGVKCTARHWVVYSVSQLKPPGSLRLLLLPGRTGS